MDKALMSACVKHPAYPHKNVTFTSSVVNAGLCVYLSWIPDDAPRSLDEADLMGQIFLAMYERLREERPQLQLPTLSEN